MKTKSGISLIAVLMFMLAATTASVVVFKLIGSENFSSGARLKRTEAYQASESGIDAVRAWLTNKAGDVGEVLYQYENTRKPILLTGKDGDATKPNLLATIGGTKNQKYKVYLTKADLNKNGRKKLEFLSVGTGRDNSKVSQKAIFSVDGLYQITIQVPSTTCEGEHCDFDYAFFGGLGKNTQGRFSSGVINGDFMGQGISSNKTLIVTGNMEVQDNGEKNIGCRSGSTTVREGDLYVGGYWKAKGFNVCGNAYIGGLLSNENNTLKFLRNLYADGGINSKGFSVDSNLTLGGNLNFGNNEKLTIGGNFVIEEYTLNAKGVLTNTPKQTVPKIMLSGNPKMEIKGSFWSQKDAFAGSGTSSGYNELKYLGNSGKSLLIPNITKCSGGNDFSCNQAPITEHYYQKIGTGAAYFSSLATQGTPSTSNKPDGANPLPELASKLTTDCFKADGKRYAEKCVPDPIEVPQATKDDWLLRGDLLNKLVNVDKNTTGLPTACIRLVLSKDKYIGSDNNDQGLDSRWGWKNNKQNDFASAANDCYAGLLSSDPKKILFPEGGTEKFLVVNVENPEQRNPDKAFNGNFIFVFKENMDKQMYLPATTNNSKVFIYFKKGATGEMPLNDECQNLQKPCKRNYFIFSDEDIAGSSGTGQINGAIFLAKGAKVTNKLPDAGVEFNKALYDALTQAGAIAMTDQYRELLGGGAGGGGSTAGISENDKRYIPVASRLLVELESKEISTEQEPIETSTAYGDPTILVMPRLLRIGEDEIISTPFTKFYSYMYMNNAGQSNKNCSDIKKCQKLGEGGNTIDFCSSGKKAKGVYKCEFTDDTKISEFYVQIGENDNNELEVNISPSPGAVIEKGGAGTQMCKTISLRTNRPPASKLTVSVTVENNTGDGWSKNKKGTACTGSSSPFTCTIDVGQQNLDILEVCALSDNPANAYIVLSLTSNSGANISKTNNKSIISLQSQLNGKVYRFPMDNNGTWKDCEQSGFMPTTIWADITCTGKKPIELNKEWECDAGQATLNINTNNLGEACELPPISIPYSTITVQSGMDNKFYASLAWKKYALKSVNGGTLKFVSSRSGQDFTCSNPSGCSEPLYHKAGYVVTASTDYGYCLGQAKSSNCTASNIDGIVGPQDSFILNPTEDVYIKLISVPAASMSCILKKTTIKETQKLEKNDFEVTFSGKGCNNLTNPDFSFSPQPPYSVTNGINITVSSNACGSPTSATCTPQLVVESNTCDYNSASHNSPTSSSPPNDLCGGLAFNNVLDNSTTIPTSGKCLFINSYLAIQANTGSIININGYENPTSKPPPIDGGYYVYVQSGSINASTWNGISAGTKNSSCKLADCKLGADVYIKEDNYAYIDPPTFTCTNGNSGSNTGFNATQGGDLDYDAAGSGWGGVGPKTNLNWPGSTHNFGTEGAGKVIRMYRINCGSGNLNFGTSTERKGIVCGTFDLLDKNNNPYFSTPSKSSDLYTPWCKLSSNCYNTNAAAQRPTFGCKIGSSAGATNPLFNYTGANNGSTMTNATNWNNNATQVFTSAATEIVAYMYQITCDGVAINFSNKTKKSGIRCTTTDNYNAFDVKDNNGCGNMPSSSSIAPSSSSSSSSEIRTITCSVAKTSVTQGENIPQPTISCSSGAVDKSGASFTATTGSVPTSVDNWKSNGNAYYSTFTSNNAIQVSNVKCGGTTVNGNTDCGTITVKKPACGGVGGTKNVGETITPTVDCGNAVKSGNPTFNGGSGWTDNGSGGGSYNSTGTKTVLLNSVTCDSHLITGITNVSCGAVSIGNCTAWTPAPGPITDGCYKPTSTKTCGMNCNSSNSGTCSVNDVTATSTGNNYMQVLFTSGTEYNVIGNITINDCY